MSKETKRFMFAGVGGQGIILASRVLAEGLLRAGLDVKSTEVHGMAQRGGSVVTQVCFGERVYSPLVGPGAIDALVALEKLEALRYIHYVKKNGILLVNNKEIPSLPILSGAVPYPQDVEERLTAFPVSLHTVDADGVAERLGNHRAMNMVLLGALLKLTGLAELTDWKEVVAEAVRPEYRGLNLKALEAGMSLV